MNREEYKQKLIQFNSTPKYQREIELLDMLVIPALPNCKILDYGCGTGDTVKHYTNKYTGYIYGYDVTDLLHECEDNRFNFRTEYHFQFDSIYFMHSIAHVPEIADELLRIKTVFLKPQGIISVITPNKKWLEINHHSAYIADPTVIKHFTSQSLEKLFVAAGFKIIMQGQFGEEKDNCHERLFIKAQSW